MSSTSVRTAIKNFIATGFPAETLIDLTAEFEYLEELVLKYGLTREDPWLGIEFIGNEETMITVPATNQQGKFRETGVIMIHIVDVARLGIGDAILLRAEPIRNSLRGMRIGDIVIESVTPPNFSMGATIDFEGGYTSATIMASYYTDLDL